MQARPPTKPRCHHRSWSTDSEIEFIDRLSARDNAPALLRGYLAGIDKRTNFTDIERADVVTHAQMRLTETERRASAASDACEAAPSHRTFVIAGVQ